MLDSPLGSEELRQQVAAASVVAVCSCGCPSVIVDVPDELPRVRWPEGTPDVRWGTDTSIVGEARTPDGRAVDVVLHVLLGAISELEIWAGGLGGDPRVELPSVETVHLIQLPRGK
jgi:hypothetical protein